MSIVEARLVFGGVDTHADVHVAAVVDGVGGELAVESFPTTPAGYAGLAAWMTGFGALQTVGVEGTGAYGAGLTRHLRRAGIEVIEVDRPNRQLRRQRGKSDTIDAVEAARAVVSGRARGVPKAANGNVEALRNLLVVRRGGRGTRVRCVNQMRHLVLTAPDSLRAQLHGTSINVLVATAARLRPDPDGDQVLFAAKTALRTLAQQVIALEADHARLDREIHRLVTATAPHLLTINGVGPWCAAVLLVTAGDNPHRLHSEAAFAALCGVSPIPASSGKTNRHRLNRGGDRDANSALWTIVTNRLTNDPTTQAYLQRRVKDGRSRRETIRCLKRYVARQLYPHLLTTSS
jgi:transposase